MWRMLTVAGVLIGLAGAGCDDPGSEEVELLRRQVEALEAAERREAEREAERLRQLEEERRAEAERQRLDALASRYAFQAGRQVMDAVGGGQDLVTRYGEWRFDHATRRFTIPISVRFNGALVRSNEYFVAGVLTVAEDGSGPRLAREQTNQNYRDAESLFLTLGVTAAGLLVLADLAEESGG